MKYLSIKLCLFFISISLTSLSSIAAKGNYKSILVIGHLYPLYNLYDIKDSLVTDGVSLLANQIKSIDNLDTVIFLGDTFVDGRDSVINLVEDSLIKKLNMNTIFIAANHEALVEDQDRLNVDLKNRGKITINDLNLIYFSPWKRVNGTAKVLIDDEDVNFFRANVSKAEKKIILITDMLHHNHYKDSGWRKKIVPILTKNNTSHIVVGDNDLIDHKYSWIELNGIRYIHQGISHNFYNPGMNTFLEIRVHENSDYEFIVHTIKLNALSPAYKLNKMDFSGGKARCEYAENFSFPLPWKERLMCKLIYLGDYF